MSLQRNINMSISKNLLLINMSRCKNHILEVLSNPGIGEHRLFSYLTMNWQARPLTNMQFVVDLIA